MTHRIPESTAEFFYDTPARLMGTETEYSVQANRLPTLDLLESLDPYRRFIGRKGQYAWLRNGAKLYYDSVGHTEAPDDFSASPDAYPEYATPECLDATQAAIHEKAGEYVVDQIAREVAHGSRPFAAHKRTAFETVLGTDEQVLMRAGSLGHHESYTTPLFPMGEGSARTVASLASYLATRPIWAGAGLVSQQGYHTAQKVFGIDYSRRTDAYSHGYKPPYTANKQGRNIDNVEIRSGDGNMSPWAIRTKLAMTSLVLRLIEHDEFPDSAIIDPGFMLAPIADRVSKNPNEQLPFSNNTPSSGVTQQQSIAHAGLALAERYDVPNDETQAALDVLQVCDQLAEWGGNPDALEPLAQRIDWAAKLQFIRQRLGGTTTLTTTNLDAVSCDLLWEAMGESSPSSRHYAAVGNTISDAAIAEALTTPPRTRAARRVKALGRYGPDDIMHASWGYVRLSDGRPAITISNPYQC